MSTPAEGRTPNRLVHEKSPYLLQHAYNPVDWYPYGEEALARARAEDKPIFLSIGYSTCHWCHVMERESFEDPVTARFMNELFVNVKIDREERPDVDQVYMQAVMALTGQGGWPLSVWLTPHLEPFYGGTYFPPDARFGRPGFRDVLRHLAHVYRTRREDVSKNCAALLEALRRGEGGHDAGREPAADLAARAAADLERLFDEAFGGFGRAPKFPRPATLHFLAHRGARTPFDQGRRMLETTLEMMWRGGLYDHVGGGFARYSTDERWLVPHFEKMLYDNALLVDAYLDGHLWTGRADFAAIVRDVLAFVKREMTHPAGGFYSAQDADSEGVEGKFYVFSVAELRSVLGEEADEAIRAFGATEYGNFEERNILHWPRSCAETARLLGCSEAALAEKAARWRCKLYGYRERRVRPGLDDKILASWNGLMIGAAARAGIVLDDPTFIELAERAAAFVDEHLRTSDGGLLRRWRDGEARYAASLDDHAALALGRLALYQATGRVGHLRRALELLDRIEATFADAGGGAYFFAAESPDLLVRMKESYDGALPSGNSLAALALARAGAITGREELRERARRVARAFAGDLERMPEAYPCLLSAWTEAGEGPRTLMIVGDGDAPAFHALLVRAHRELFPGRVVVPVRTQDRPDIEALGVPLAGRDARPGTAAAWLCEDFACRAWPAS